MGGEASEGGEPPLPILVCFLCGVEGRQACENTTHIGMKKCLEETHLSCFLLPASAGTIWH